MSFSSRVVLGLSVLILPLGQAMAGGPVPSCDFAGSWVTSDHVAADGAVRAMTSSEKSVFAAGQLNVQRLIRRSQDRGATWQTVENAAPGSSASYVGGIVAFPGHVFAAENVVIGAKIHWVIRRSDDDGTTWTTVNDFVAPAGVTLNQVSGITRAPDGALYVVGSEDVAGTFHWITRRSDDLGATFTTVDDFTGGVAYTVVAAPNGGVFAGGAFVDPATKNGYWITRYSFDGTHWKEGDRLLSGTNGGANAPQGSVADANGSVILAGSAYDPGDNKYHWIVRRANAFYPKTWHTIDDYTIGTQPKFALAMGVTIALDGQVFVTGTANDAVNNEYVTRSSVSAWDPFGPSDLLAAHGSSSGFAAATGAAGDVFTGGQLADPMTNAGQWLVRLLRCN